MALAIPRSSNGILQGKLKTTQTPGGHHRISQASLKPLLGKDRLKPAAESRERFRRVSGRNQLAGTVVGLRVEGLMAEVIVELGDGSLVTSIITAAAVRELALKKGDAVAALMKSTDVMIERLEA